MATKEKRFLVRIIANLTDAQTKFRSFGRFMDATFGGVVRSVFNLQNAIAGLGAGLATRYVTQAIDKYTLLRGQLKLVTRSEEELAQTEKDLFKIAQQTRSAYEATVTLYARVARNTEELNLRQSQLLALTEATNKAIQIGGQTQQEAPAGTIQFSQALAAGVLRGDEFRSVAENMPRLAQAIADGLNIPLGKLRELANEGKLTSELVIQALLQQKQALDREYTELPKTIGQSLTQIKNEFERTLSQTDVTELNRSLDDFRTMISEPQMMQSIITFGTAVVTAMRWGIEAGSKLVEITQRIAESVASFDKGEGGKNFNLDYDGLIAKEKELTDKIEARKKLLGGEDNEAESAVKKIIKNYEDELAHVKTLISNYNELNKGRSGGNQLTEVDLSTLPTRRIDTGRLFGKTGPDIDKQFQKSLADMQRQLELMGQTTTAAAVLYETQNGGLRELLPQQKEELVALAEKIDLKNREMEMDQEDQRRREQLRSDVENLRADLMTEEESLRAYYENRHQLLIDALSAEELTREEFRQLEAQNEAAHQQAILDMQKRKREEAERDAADSMSEFAVQAARNMQSAMSDFFFDAMNGEFDNLVSNFKRTIDRLVAEAAASKLFDFIGKTAGSGDGIEGIINSIFSPAGGKAIGGGAGKYEYMQINEHGREFLALGDNSGTVIPPEQMLKHMGGGHNITINISTPDAGSFKKSQAQVATDIGIMIDRAMRRNR